MPDAWTTHPTPQQLTAYGLRTLPPGELAAIQEHVRACPECRRKLQGPSPSSFTGSLRATPRSGTQLPASPPSGSKTALPSHHASANQGPDDVPPELLASTKFEILGKLGQGGMGAVFKAKHTFLGEIVAIKVMNADVLGHPEARSRFLREMMAAGQLKHPHIVRALDAEQIGDLLVLVMEYVAGATLDRLVTKRGPLPVTFSCQCIMQAALGLQHAHEKGMVHRDIKPANLMVTAREKEVKLLDFGLARGPREQMGKGHQTQMQTFMGTPEYVAPEQATDARNADIRADVYSLGCTLYFLLAGRPPFQAATSLETILAHIQLPAQPLTELRPDVPAALSAVVAKMMAKKPADRYPTPIEAAHALQPFVVAAKGEGPAAGAPPALPIPLGRTIPPPLPPEESLFDAPAATDAPGSTSRRPQQKGKWPTWTVYAAGVAASLVPTFLLGWLLVTWADSRDNQSPKEIATAPSEKLPVREEPAPVPLPPARKKTPALDANPLDKNPSSVRSVAATESEKPPIPPALEPDPPKEEKRPVLEAPPLEGFASLFNGKDLTGWKPLPTMPLGWKVDADGQLVGSGATCYLFSEREDYKNFHFLVEAKINDAGRAVQGFRACAGPGLPSGYAAHLNSTNSDPTRTGSLSLGTGSVEIRNAGIRPDEWFTQEVVVVDNNIIVKVDGKVTVDATITDQKRYRARGALALQIVGPGTTATFRKILVKELPETMKRFPARVSGSRNPGWRVEGQELLGHGRDREQTIVFGDSRWTDYDFSVEAMTAEPTNGFGLSVRAVNLQNADTYLVGGNGNTDLEVRSFVAGQIVDPSPAFRSFRTVPGLARGLQPFRWYKARVSVRGSAGSCYLDGQKMFDFRADRHSQGNVALRAWSAPVRFRNIQVTNPDGAVLLEGVPDLDPRQLAEEVREVGRLSGFHNPISTGLAFVLNGKRLVAAETGLGAELSIWDVARRSRLAAARIQNQGVAAMAINPSGRAVALYGYLAPGVAEYQFWALNPLAKFARLNPVPALGAVNIRFLSDNKRLQILHRSLESLHVVDPLLSRETRRVQASDGPKRPALGYAPATAVSPDNRLIAVGDSTGLIRIWDAETGKDVQQFNPAEPDGVSALLFHPDGKRVISGTYSGRLNVWAREGGQPAQRFSGGHRLNSVRCLGVTLDGKRLLSGGGDGTICVWDLATATLACRLVGHEASVGVLAVSPGGNTVASGSFDKTVRLWQLPK